MTTLEILKAARELIAKPGGWCQRAYARDSIRWPVSFESGGACAFCAEGAILRTGAGLADLNKLHPTTLHRLDKIETTQPKTRGS